MKKIKKENPIPPRKTTNELLDFLRADKKDAPPREKPVNYKLIPSKRPEFKKRDNKDIDKWNGWDFLGFYLYIYLEEVKEEDGSFKRQNAYQFSTERSLVTECLKTHFNGDKVKFKEYIEFIIPWWRSESSWIEADDKYFPGFKGIFSSRSNAFYRAFMGAKNAGPKKTNRFQADNNAASLDPWLKDLEDEQ